MRSGGATQYHDLEKLIEQAELTPENLKALEERRPDPDECSQILPTGGTTGLPKLSPRSHNCYMNNVEYHAYRWEMNSQDTIMVITPLGHNLSVHWGMAAAFFAHAKLVLLDSVKPQDICEWVQREKVTAIPTVPALIARVVQMDDLAKYDLSSLKKISVGGAPSTQELVKSVYDKIGCQFINGFGSVEGTCASTKPGDSIEVICGSVGKPICPYDELKVVDPDGNEVPWASTASSSPRGPASSPAISNPRETGQDLYRGRLFQDGRPGKKG